MMAMGNMQRVGLTLVTATLLAALVACGSTTANGGGGEGVALERYIVVVGRDGGRRIDPLLRARLAHRRRDLGRGPRHPLLPTTAAPTDHRALRTGLFPRS